MIRDFQNADFEPVLDIWLQASILRQHRSAQPRRMSEVLLLSQKANLLN